MQDILHEVRTGPAVKVVAGEFYDHGLRLIDLRKFMLYPNLEGFLPSRTKGIRFNVEHWPAIRNMVDELIYGKKDVKEIDKPASNDNG